MDGQNDSNTLGVDGYFFKNGGKNLPFQTKTDTTNANDFGNIKNYTAKGVNISTQLKSTYRNRMFLNIPLLSYQFFRQVSVYFGKFLAKDKKQLSISFQSD